MRRRETATIGRRLTHVRAKNSQKAQAQLLGVGERTYQNYEQDNRPPDLRTLLGLFTQGWDLNWVLCGVGLQRLDPRAVIEYVLWEIVALEEEREDPALPYGVLQWQYGTRRFPVPSWVYEELPALTDHDIEAIVNGTWALPPAPSHGLQLGSVKLAAKLLHEALDEADARIPPDQAGEATSILAQLLESGLPEAKVRPHARQLAESYGAGGSHGATAGAGGQVEGDHARSGSA